MELHHKKAPQRPPINYNKALEQWQGSGEQQDSNAPLQDQQRLHFNVVVRQGHSTVCSTIVSLRARHRSGSSW
jgi:hypothetical protein